MTRTFIRPVILLLCMAIWHVAAAGAGDDERWAQVALSVASMRAHPAHSAELVSQTTMGMPVRLVQTQPEWALVESIEGYRGWISRHALVEITPEGLDTWRKASRCVVTSPYRISAYSDTVSIADTAVVTDLLPGNIMVVLDTVSSPSRTQVQLQLPDGRTAWVESSSVDDFARWATQDFDPELILDRACAMMGTPYLWGGTSAYGVDCSGLVKIAYFANALILPRDASQQAKAGKWLEAGDWRDYKAADLVFFGSKEGGKVNHVGIYDHDGGIVHCSGRVRRNSVDPESALYMPSRVFLGGVRVSDGGPGIVRAIEHPWLF